MMSLESYLSGNHNFIFISGLMQFDFPADFSGQKHRHTQHARVIFLAGWVEVGQFVHLMFSFLSLT